MNLIGDSQTDKARQKKNCMMDENVFVLCHEFDWGQTDRQTNKFVQKKKCMMDQNGFMLRHEFDWGQTDRQDSTEIKSVQKKYA